MSGIGNLSAYSRVVLLILLHSVNNYLSENYA